jgi:hypothetical protein
MIAAEIRIDYALNGHDEQVAWCFEHFGSEARFKDQVDDDRPWLTEYALGGHWWWYFAKKEYATLFVLRWI